MNREQRRRHARELKRKRKAMAQGTPLPPDRTNIAYGHNQKDRIIVEFSRNVRTLLMTPTEALGMIAEMQHAMEELAKYQREHNITPPAAGGLNG